MTETTPIGGGSGEAPEEEPASERPSDPELLQHLGAAVLLCRSELPIPTQVKILAQADDVLGTRPDSGRPQRDRQAVASPHQNVASPLFYNLSETVFSRN
jgi:hypothetical protein